MEKGKFGSTKEDDISFANEWARNNPKIGQWKSDYDTERFLDDEEDKRFASMYGVNLHLLKYIDDDIKALRHVIFLSFSYHKDTEYIDVLNRYQNNECYRRARKWNSQLNYITPNQEIESIQHRIDIEKHNLIKLLSEGPLNNKPMPELQPLPEIQYMNSVNRNMYVPNTVDEFYKENSYNMASFVHGWFTRKGHLFNE